MAYFKTKAGVRQHEAWYARYVDALIAAGIDPGVKSMLVVYDLASARAFRVGHGLAAFVDNKYQKPRRAKQSQICGARTV